MKRVPYLVVVIVILFACGCTATEPKEGSQIINTSVDTNALEKDFNFDINIPGLKLEYNDKSVSAIMGTYSWHVEKDGKGKGVEADAGAPEVLIRDQKQEIVINNAEDIHLVFDREPTSYTVRIWNEDDYEASKEIEVIDDKISIVKKQPRTIYEVIAEFSFNADLKESGIVYYAFVVNEDNMSASAEIKVINEGEQTEGNIDDADIIVMVSNQSFDAPEIKMSGTINGVAVFNDKFHVGNQHEFSTYLVEAETGEYTLSIVAEDITLDKAIQIKESEPLWIGVTYWKSENENGHIDVYMQNEPIFIR